MAVKEALTNKIGPLPTWGWVAIIGGAIVAYAYYRNRKNTAAASAPADVTPPVIDQFQLTTPPVQEDEDDDAKHGKIIRTPGHPAKDIDPTQHHRRHHHRHPKPDHDHDKDDRRPRAHSGRKTTA